MDQTLPTRLTCWACCNTHFKDIDSSATPCMQDNPFFARLFNKGYFWICKLQGCTLDTLCFFKSLSKNSKDLNLTPPTQITKWFEIKSAPLFFQVAWQLTTARSSSQRMVFAARIRVSNPVSMCLPGCVVLLGPQHRGRHRLRIFPHRQATNGREFQQIRDRSWKERDSRARRNLRGNGERSCELCVFWCVKMKDQWSGCCDQAEMTFWHWSVLKPLKVASPKHTQTCWIFQTPLAYGSVKMYFVLEKDGKALQKARAASLGKELGIQDLQGTD